jgi:hypothetical protein
MRDIQTDLARSIHRVSACGRFFYTERQLYHELCRTMRSFVRFWRSVPFVLPQPVSFEKFSRALKQLISCSGMPAKLLADSQDWQPEFVGVEPDLADYGLQRVLICTDRDIAAMLIANHIHMELGCAVLSLSEAMPLPDMICAMLARDQAPRIFLLHDADLEGMTLLSHARVRLRIPEDMSLVEVGLRPFQAMRMHLFVERTEAGTVEGWHFLDGLSHFEGWWVKAGLRATISGISPLTLFRFLRQSIVLGK